MMNNNQMSYKYPFWIVLMLLFFAGWIANEQKKTIDSFKGTVINSDSATIITQKQRIVSLEDAVKLGLIEKTKLLDKINSQTHVKGETIIIEKEIKVNVPVYVYVDSSTGEKFNCVKLPVPIRYEDSFNLFCGELDSAKFTLDTLLVKNSFSVSIGERKTKWWKSPEPTVEIASNNPNTKIEVSSVQIKQSKPFYKTVWFGGVVGFIVAAILLI